MGDDAFGINRATLASMVEEIKQVLSLGVQLGIVVGGGSIFRGVALGATGMDRATDESHGDACNCHEWHGSAGCFAQCWSRGTCFRVL